MPRTWVSSLILLCAAFSAGAQTVPLTRGQGSAGGGTVSAQGPRSFAFSYTTGDKFRVLSEVEESVYVDHRLSHRARILNRIAFETADAAQDGSWGLLRGSFETSEQQLGGEAYVISESYDSEFKRDRLGRYEIDPKYYMPVVRNVPVFPERELSPGDSWTAPGEERHDFRRAFGIPEPYTIPFEARYRYVGSESQGGKELLLITASYTIFVRPPPPRSYGSIFPVQIAGFSDQKIRWDPELGQPVAYEERFDFVFDWSDGSTIEYKGTARSEVIEAELMDRESLKAEAEKAVEGIEGVSVDVTEEGVTISIENLQFEPDSAVLKATELDKLARVGELLARYPERDVLVAGHAAAAGYAAGRQKLSEDRARAVAERLIAIGAKTPERIRAVGYGDTKPVADNATEEGRARNRRVEITILEN
jgi:outer membrane protein OmpA-like peptidoglycan-associated protein